MFWIDFLIVGVIAISTIISLMRGFVQESISLASWIFSFLIAWKLNANFATFFQGSIENQQLRFMVAFLILLIISLIMFGIVNFFASRLVQRSGLSKTDRSIGLLFGFLRGVILVTILTALAWKLFPQSPMWKEAFLLDIFQAIAAWLIDKLAI